MKIESKSRVQEALQIAAGGLILACLVIMLGAGSFGESRSLVLPVMLAAGVAWWGAIWAAGRGIGRLGVILPLAIAMRLVVLGGDLELSDDLWRYAWEGGLVLEGQSPYALAPDAAELGAEREAWAGVYERMNNVSISAAYPPVTQFFVAGVVRVLCGASGPISRAAPPDSIGQARLANQSLDGLQRGLRAAFSLLDLVVLIPLFGLLKRRGLPIGLLVVWAWSPLVVWEFAASAHFDSLGILFMVAALWAWGAKDPRAKSWSVPLLGLAFLTKYLPLIAAPFLLRRANLPRTVLAVFNFAIITAVGFASVLHLDGGLAGIFHGLGEYGLRWESWNLTYRWLEPLFDSMGERNEGSFDPRRIGRLAIGLAAALFVLRLFLKRVEAGRAIFWSLAAFLILTPTLHPWYLTWILPFAALVPGREARPWLWLAAASPILYWPLTEWQARAEWIEPSWSWPAVAIPFFVLLAAVAVIARRHHESI